MHAIERKRPIKVNEMSRKVFIPNKKTLELGRKESKTELGPP